MDNEPFQLQPTESPFQMSVILKEVFSWLPYSDLVNCRQVSKLWDCEASKQLWKVSRSFASFRWRGVGNGGNQMHFTLDESKGILEAFRSRNSSSSDSLISVHIGSPPRMSMAQLSYYRSHYHDIGRTVHGFLTNPVLCNLLASIKLEPFADLDVVLRLLSELPNLREFIWNFDVVTFFKTQSTIPDWYKTSPIHKLKLSLSGYPSEQAPLVPTKLTACFRVLLGGCVNLGDLRIVDNTRGTLLKGMDGSYLNALVNPGLIRRLCLDGSDDRTMPVDFTGREMLQMLRFFPNITHLNLLEWGVFDFEDWKYVISSNFLPQCLTNLCMRICSPNGERRYFPNRLIYNELLDTGMDRLEKLKTLKILFHPMTVSFLHHPDWIEEWKFVEESLSLVRARITYHGRSDHVDLRPHKHLRHLTLITLPSMLPDLLKLVPPTVKRLDVGPFGNPVDATDNDFRLDGALKALNDLERFRIRQSCGQCTESILKHVFAEMKNLQFVQLPGRNFTEAQLEKYGLANVTFSHESSDYDDLF